MCDTSPGFDCLSAVKNEDFQPVLDSNFRRQNTLHLHFNKHLETDRRASS